MAERDVRPEVFGNKRDSGVVDLSNDARWKARLEEARARREIALREQGRDMAPPPKPKKPWETEGAPELPDEADDADPGFDFHDRINTLKTQVKAREAEVASRRQAARRGSNWHPDADEDSEVAPETGGAAPAPKVEAAPAPAPKARSDRVDAFFQDPEFAGKAARSQVADDDPVSLLLKPEPMPERRPSRPAWIVDDSTPPAPEPEPVAATPAEPRRRRRLGPLLAGVALLAAIAVGPLYQMTRPVERGPLIYRSPVFALQPALGITAAMAEWPSMTVAREWQPKAAPRGLAPATPAYGPAILGGVAALPAVLPDTDTAPVVVWPEPLGPSLAAAPARSTPSAPPAPDA